MMNEQEKKLQSYLPAFQKKDFSSFTEFYEEAKRPIFYNIYALTKSREDSEDILQATFVRFLETVDEVKPGASIMGSLMVISRNLALDSLKKKKHDYLTDEDWDTQGQEEDRSSNLDAERLLERIQGILKDKEFEIFVLHVMNEMSFQEIAEWEKRPLGTILWSYSNSLKKIRKEIPYETV